MYLSTWTANVVTGLPTISLALVLSLAVTSMMIIPKCRSGHVLTPTEEPLGREASVPQHLGARNSKPHFRSKLTWSIVVCFFLEAYYFRRVVDYANKGSSLLELYKNPRKLEGEGRPS